MAVWGVETVQIEGDGAWRDLGLKASRLADRLDALPEKKGAGQMTPRTLLFLRDGSTVGSLRTYRWKLPGNREELKMFWAAEVVSLQMVLEATGINELT